MHFSGLDKSRVLTLYDNTTVRVGDGQLVEYRADYYEESIADCLFVGKVECSRISSYETVGIYIMPLYLFKNNKWYKIQIDGTQCRNVRYPHLLMAYNGCASRATDTLDTVRTIETAPLTDETVILSYE
jgi:hypothetical protein